MDQPKEFSTLIAVSEAVGFNEILQANGDMTFFAPNDDAFTNLMPTDLLEKYFDFDLWTEEYLARLLSCHDIQGSVIFSFQFQNGTQIIPCVDIINPTYTVTTPPPKISASTMPVPANIVEADLLAKNGVVHVIDQVMTNSFLRMDLPESAEAFGGFNILLELVVNSGLLDFVSGPGPFTLYAPPDSVFESYGLEFIDGLRADPEGTKEILLNHVVPDLIVPCCLPAGSQVTSAAGFKLTIDNVNPENPSVYTINGVATIPELTGILTSNSKVNTISDILFLPSSLMPVAAPSTSKPASSGSIIPSTSPNSLPISTSHNPSLSPSQTSESPSVAPIPMPDSSWDYLLSRKSDFATYIAVSEAVGYEKVLQGSSAITVFAPLESAFQSLEPSDLLVKYIDVDAWTGEFILALLNCHDVEDEVILSTDLVSGTKFATCKDLIHPEYKFTSPPPQISIETMPVPANLVEVDIVTGTGVVHVVDQVLTNSFFRYDVLEAGEAFGQFSILLELIELTGLNDFFTGPGPFTVFAPPDEVFEGYGQDFIINLQADVEGTRRILLNHVVAGTIIPCCTTTSTTFESAAGFPLVLDDIDEDDPSMYTVNGIKTVPNLSNLLVSNAKVNTITDILVLPTSEGSSIPSGRPSQMPSTK